MLLTAVSSSSADGADGVEALKVAVERFALALSGVIHKSEQAEVREGDGWRLWYRGRAVIVFGSREKYYRKREYYEPGKEMKAETQREEEGIREWVSGIRHLILRKGKRTAEIGDHGGNSNVGIMELPVGTFWRIRRAIEVEGTAVSIVRGAAPLKVGGRWLEIRPGDDELGESIYVRLITLDGGPVVGEAIVWERNLDWLSRYRFGRHRKWGKLWFPSEIKEEFYHAYRDGSIQPVIRKDSTILRAEFGIEVDEQTLTPVIPVGTYVAPMALQLKPGARSTGVRHGFSWNPVQLAARDIRELGFAVSWKNGDAR